MNEIYEFVAQETLSHSHDIMPFMLPDELAGSAVVGTIERFGSVLLKEDRIFGYVQEAFPFQEIVTSANPASMLLESGTLVSSLTANIQLEQVKKMLGGLQLLSGATLAASLVGLGVSVAGFAMVNKKLKVLTEKLDALSSQIKHIEEKIDKIRTHQQAQKFAKLSALLALGEEAWTRQDKFSTWNKISDQLLEEDHYYRHLLCGMGSQTSIFLEEAYPLDFCVLTLERLATVNSARFQSLLLCGELEAAKHYGLELAKWYYEAFDTLSPIDIASAKAPHIAEETKRSCYDATRELLQTTKPFMESLRELQCNMATRPQFIQTLIDRQIDGYEYIRRLRQEKTHPFLILPDNTPLTK